MILPEMIIELTEPLEISFKRCLVVNDIHIPFQDNNALEIALKGKYDTLILNGDILDFYALSKFTKNPSMNFLTERQSGLQFFGYLRGKHPKARIIWQLGNHETRLQQYIWSKAPALFGLPTMTIEQLFNTGKYRIEVIPNGQFIKAGHLHIIHGNEGGGNALINVARSRLLASFSNVLSAHSHVTQEFITRTIGGHIIGSWSNGCLCQLKPQYRPLNNWNHGFAEIEMDGKDFQIHLKKIYGGKIY